MLWGGGAGNSSEWTPFQPWGQEEGDVWPKHLSESAFPFNSQKKFRCPSWVSELFLLQGCMGADRISGSYYSSSVSLGKFSVRVRSTFHRQRREIKRNLVLDNIPGLWQNTLGELTLSHLTEHVVPPLLFEPVWIMFLGPCNMKAILVHWSKSKDWCQWALKVGKWGYYPM